MSECQCGFYGEEGNKCALQHRHGPHGELALLIPCTPGFWSVRACQQEAKRVEEEAQHNPARPCYECADTSKPDKCFYDTHPDVKSLIGKADGCTSIDKGISWEDCTSGGADPVHTAKQDSDQRQDEQKIGAVCPTCHRELCVCVRQDEGREISHDNPRGL